MAEARVQRDENKPVEGFDKLYDAYTLMVADGFGEPNIEERCATMDEDELLLIASSSSSSVLLENVFKSTKNLEVLLELSKNKYTSSHVLDTILTIRNTDLTIGLATNANLSQDALTALERHSLAHIRRLVSENPSIPIEALERLLEDPETIVRLSALRVLKARKDSPFFGMPSTWMKKLLG